MPLHERDKGLTENRLNKTYHARIEMHRGILELMTANNRTTQESVGRIVDELTSYAKTAPEALRVEIRANVKPILATIAESIAEAAS